MPRKEWTEYYFFKSMEPDLKAMEKFDRRYAREFVRRRENPKPRYAFSAWVAVGPNPIDGGSVALLPGSHLLTGFLSPLRKDEEVPLDFKKNVKEWPWVATDMEAGDVLLIDVQTARAFVSNRRAPPFVGAFADGMYLLK